MARLSINEVTTFRWTFEEDVAALVAAGIKSMGVWRQKLADYGEDKGVELLAEHGLAVSNLLWAGGFTGSDGRTYRESIDDAADAIQLAAQLNAGCLIVYTGARAGHTHNHARRLTKDALSELLPRARDAGVQLAIEPMHPTCSADWTFLNSLDDALAMLDAVDSPQLGLVFDTYHWGHGPDVVDLIPQFADRVSIVHLGDGRQPPGDEQDRCRLGEGTVPLKEIIAAFAAAGYDGDYDVELLGEEVEQFDYRELIEHSKRAFAELSRFQTV
jgi:sugar phosphate isomerase/epimerase